MYFCCFRYFPADRNAGSQSSDLPQGAQDVDYRLPFGTAQDQDFRHAVCNEDRAQPHSSR